MGERNGSLEETPTWAVSVFAMAFFFLAFVIETSLHHLAKFLRRRRIKSFERALGKIKTGYEFAAILALYSSFTIFLLAICLKKHFLMTEMMKMGFISLLLTITEASIPNICVSEGLPNSFLPCRDSMESSMEPAVFTATQAVGSNSPTTLPAPNSDQTHCESKGMVSLMSREGVSQLNILISVLAVFHVLYCILTMCLGIAKIKKWKAWEKETQAPEYQIANDPRRFRLIRQTSIGKRHLNFYASHPLLVWPVCFIRQFSGSVSKSDYFTLRNGFIASNIAEGSEFNFQKFLHRAFDHDFVQVIQIRFWIWIFSILFIFFSAHEFYNYYWLPFIPLAIVITVGTKLEVIITKMCVESSRRNLVSQGAFLVNPSDELFWFSRPSWVLHLIQFVLIQNSFQLAFLTWTWFEFGIKSCFSRTNEVIAIRIGMGVGVQLLCGYVTLPLYALVTQMGSSLKRTVFTERIVEGLKNWQNRSKRSLSKKPSTSTTAYWKPISFHSHHATNDSLYASDSAKANTGENLQPSSAIVSLSPSSGQEITAEEECKSALDEAIVEASSSQTSSERGNPKVGMKGNYDGEISFASSWKEMEIKWIRKEGDDPLHMDHI